MEETCKLRQENELQAIQAIYMDDFQDLLEKVLQVHLIVSLPHSIVTGKPFDDQKSRWKKVEGLTWQYLWNYCLLQAKRRNLPQKSKLLVSGVKLSRASNRITRSG
ncbi:hypothetical protein P5673_031386 [Acropora cervicornis]|uniref:Uncharacterized protein n=1 Tax=Acropora cervicornis TaxID=6130 RepID=A0AAD9USK8_ACRCE|nr:hypothetical protein P5673_031386 [Acropora cervicornis]